MTKSELESVINNPLSDEKQRANAQALLDKLTDTGTDTEYMLADAYRTAHALGWISDEEKHRQFEGGRKYSKHPAFSESEEKKPAKQEWIAAWKHPKVEEL